MKLAARALAILITVAVFLFGWTVVNEWRAGRAAAEFVAEGEARDSVRVREMGPMPADLIESSGLAVSVARPGMFWSHNDSGDTPRLFAVDHEGVLKSIVSVREASAIDWESMDIGVCPTPTTPSMSESDEPGAAPDTPRCLYVGDIGDNRREREYVEVYVVPEPGEGLTEVTAMGSVRFSYTDGPHDSEALAVTPNGDLIVITKGRTPKIWLHTIPAPAVAQSMSGEATLWVGPGVQLPIQPDWSIGRAVTGASFSPDGSILAVRTYSEIYFFDWPILGTPHQPAPPCYLGRLEPQGEAIAFLEDGGLLLTSETTQDRAGLLRRVECPGIPLSGR